MPSRVGAKPAKVNDANGLRGHDSALSAKPDGRACRFGKGRGTLLRTARVPPLAQQFERHTCGSRRGIDFSVDDFHLEVSEGVHHTLSERTIV
jgi:hypothetical protein